MGGGGLLDFSVYLSPLLGEGAGLGSRDLERGFERDVKRGSERGREMGPRYFPRPRSRYVWDLAILLNLELEMGPRQFPRPSL